MLDESAGRARAGQQWEGPSSALQGLLRKLGAGLDDLLPSASSSHGRLKTILASLRGSDEGMQLASLSELCEMLSIGTEESMSALSVDAFTPLLIGLLRTEQNPDLMLLASRALCHMMDAIPSSSAAVVHFDGVQLFCERLLSIEYIDLAEQALHALEKLSQEHPLAVLRAGGMLAVLQYVDFFAMGVQRRAVATAANMCRGLPVECAHLVADSVPLLSNMLNHHDQKLLENACLALNRLAESFAHSAAQLEMLAAQGLLPNLLRLVGGMVKGASSQSDAPVQLSDATYTMLLRTLATLCRGSPSLCKQLLQLDASSTVHDILAIDSAAGDAIAAAVSRPHDQLYQILSLAHELLPPLPKPPPLGAAAAGASAPASAAFKAGAAAPKRRSKRGGAAQDAEGSEEEQTPAEGSSSAPVPDRSPSAREQALLDEPMLVELYAQRLFALFMLVHSGAVNASVRSKSLSCMAKVLYFYPTTGLREMVRHHSIAAFIAPLLSMQDPAAANMALTMADILMSKLPAVYTDMFLREGVFDATARLAATTTKTQAGAPAAAGPSAASDKTAAPEPAPSQPLRRTSRGRLSDFESPGASSGAAPPSDAVRHRNISESSSRAAEGAEPADAPTPAGAPTGAMAPPAPRAPQGGPAAVAMAAEAVAQLASRSAKFNETFVSVDPTLAAAVASGEGSETLQKLRGLASAVVDTSLYSTLNRKVPLAGAWTAYADVHALRQLACLLDDLPATSGVSTFELSKSGLVEGLLGYLTASKGEADDADAAERRRVRLRVFCTVFLGLPPPSLLSPTPPRNGVAAPSSLPPAADRPAGAPPALGALVVKLQDVLNMVERFPLALNESSSSDSNSHGLKALTQPFKLRLTRAAGEAATLKEYASNVVLIEPLATIGAVEEFLWSKVRRSQARASHDSERDAEEEEDDEEEGEGAQSAASSGGAASSAPAAGSGSSGSAGKAPLRSTDKPAPAPPASSARSSGKGKEGGVKEGGSRGAPPTGRVGVVLSGFGTAVGGQADDEEEDPMEEDEEYEDEEDEEEGSLVGSPAFGASLDGGECVHDLQLSSPARRGDSAKSLGSDGLPGAAASRKAGSSRGVAGSSAAAEGGRASPNAAPSPKASDVGGASAVVDSCAHPAGGGAASSPGGTAEVAPAPSAAALEERQQKLVLQFNGRALPSSMSIFQAIRQCSAGTPASSAGAPPSSSSSLSQRMWGSVYTLQYRLATPADAALVGASADADLLALGDRDAAEAEAPRETRVLPVDANPLDGPLGTAAPPMDAEAGEPATPVLQLLWFLHRLNEQWSCIFSPAELAEAARPRGPALPPSVFFNSKLNAKLMRQLQDPLALCSRSFPGWCGGLTSACPFLFSFESRRVYLHSTAFGLSRALQRMQAHASEGGAGGANGSSEPRAESRLGRLQRQKVRIYRSRVVDSAIKVMELYASQKALLEVR
jgi:E3 ubiquitin-protein ligase TRIP12